MNPEHEAVNGPTKLCSAQHMSRAQALQVLGGGVVHRFLQALRPWLVKSCIFVLHNTSEVSKAAGLGNHPFTRFWRAFWGLVSEVLVSLRAIMHPSAPSRMTSTVPVLFHSAEGKQQLTFSSAAWLPVGNT